MNKILISAVCLLALSFTAIPVSAQTRTRCTTRGNTGYDRRVDYPSGGAYDRGSSRYGRNRTDVYNNSAYRNDSQYYDYGYRDRSFWEKHRDKITTVGGAAAGAVIGSVVGGRRGALVGAVAGAGGAALYTYKIRNKYPRY